MVAARQAMFLVGCTAGMMSLFVIVSCQSFASEPPVIVQTGQVVLEGEICFPDQLSALGVLDNGRFLIVGADEGPRVQVLRRLEEDRYSLHETINLASDRKSDDEIDIEAIACRGRTVYVIGSHSRKRPLLKEDKSQKANRARLAEIVREPLRERVFRIELDTEGRIAAPLQWTSLVEYLENDPSLRPFLAIPGKENGIDIEGLAAVGDDELVAGFRSPVFREGFVPLVFFRFDRPRLGRTVYVNLGGCGVRDITRVSDGFLIIAGPATEQPGRFDLYYWNGRDCVPGRDVETVRALTLLGQIPLPNAEAKAEGLAVLRETPTRYEILIVYDGAAQRHALQFVAGRGEQP